MPEGVITKIDLPRKIGWIRELTTETYRFFGFNESPDLNISELGVGDKVHYDLALSPLRNEEKAVNIVRLIQDDVELAYGYIYKKHNDGYAFAKTRNKGESIFVPAMHKVEHGDFISFVKEETQKGIIASRVRRLDKMYAHKNDNNTITPCSGEIALNVDIKNALNFIENGTSVEYVVDKNNDVALLRSTYSLSNFAVFNRGQFIDALKSIVHPAEEWSYSNSVPYDPYPILRSYIYHTFERLVDEDKNLASRMLGSKESDINFHKKIKQISVNKNDLAIFNTGLIDKYYREIFCVFKKNPDDRQGVPPYVFERFAVPGSSSGTILLSIKPLPERARYYDKSIELFFDPDMEIYPNFDHIFERSSRIHLLKYKHLKEEDLNDAIIEDITQKINNALDTARRKIQWNYKTAIPQYFTTKKKMQFLIPLCLEDPARVDLAMAVDKAPEDQAYTGHTILPLEWAYSNARLLTRPESDWLKPEMISVAG